MTSLPMAFSPPLALNDVVSWGELALGAALLVGFAIFPRLVLLVMGKRRGRYFLRTLRASLSDEPGEGFKPDWWRSFDADDAAGAGQPAAGRPDGGDDTPQTS